ncbi:unnamed protein product [Thelazia callipaeda]|uniref:protein-serine/threonine phosphatase n=1 Tax=Thelazia callipaeda TaxID=103827 RepID=A0A0N5D6L2_THECL|nr:unnamed protein product [Thelazia callipaeda]
MKRTAVDIELLPELIEDKEHNIAIKVRKSSWTLISGIICGAILMACIIAVAVLLITRRRRKRRDVMNAYVGDVVTKQAAAAAEEEESDNKIGGMVCTPGETSFSNVIHSNRTDTVVLPQLNSTELKTLLRTLNHNEVIKVVPKSKKPPTITRVITYATSDDITSIENTTINDGVTEDNDGDLLTKLIKNGPRQYPFKFDELREMLLQGARILIEEPTLLEVPLPCTVYGDIHGQYSDLHRWFNLNGWPSQVRSVFLGDYVDRGSHGIEVIALLISLKIRFPKNIYLCRGNHEEESLNRAYSFHDEVRVRFPESPDGKDGRTLYTYFRSLFNNLPLAVLIGGRILGMHGGIGPKLTSLQAIREIRRPLEEFEVGSLECDLVWSDPDTTPNHDGFRNNMEREPLYGIGQLFAPDTVQNCCKKLGIDMMIRGHQAPLYGYALFSGGCMLTVFSAPGYKGTSKNDINMGASIEISTCMNIAIKQIQVSEKFRQKRIADSEHRKASSHKSKQTPSVNSQQQNASILR